MASSSNPDFRGAYDYDIFLSFRGLDSRKKFTDHLYKALVQEGFRVFRDDDEIERGENIKSELQKAIWNSRMSIIVLSENYANSRACLFELQTILEHSKKSDHLMLPVFYEAVPWEIKEQAKNLDFGKNRVRVEEVEGWRAALKEVASMIGMVSGNQSDGYEARFVEEIVGELKSKLADKHWRVADHLKLDKNMQNLKRKVEYLSNQGNDINEEIKSVDRQPWKRPKKEVEVWLRDVQRLKEDVQRLEQVVVAESNVFSRAMLGNLIVQKTQEVVEPQEEGRVSDDLMINELPSGRLLIPPTECFVEFTETRNTEKVWECLMNDDVRRIGVYGMGGVGKTTIMKHIHNQLLEEKANFDMVYWVTVSKAFNFRKLQSDIAKALNLSFGDDEDEMRRASELHAALSRNKKYVLILDDLWEAFPLDLVGIPEPTRSNGCKIVLTTRSLEVCRRMNCTPVKVELLTEQEALTLFIRKAVTNDMVLAPEAEVIAAAIVRECACLPLAIVTVAGSLRGLDGTREWKNALNELISLTKEETDAESEVFEQLKFSYSRLGNALLQDCFLYCSLYPEDHSIPVEELIEYWIAEELIAEMNSVESKFDKGHAILGKLKSSCLLESFTDEAGEEWLSMHPLIRDMALQIARRRPRFMVKAGERLESVPYEDWSDDLDRISFMYSQIRELPSRPPVCPRLTTLLLSYIHLSEIPDSFFINMPFLGVLDLSGNKIQSLPESMSNLENLHALFLVDCRQLKYVPSLEKLKALKVFKLTHSLIEEVPKGLEELVNIRKLDLSNNTRLWTFPSHKLRWLSKLQYLRIDGTGVKVSAEDLLCLRQLKVVAVCFHNVKELAKYGTSQQCQGLEMYCLLVGKIFSERKLVGKDVCIISKSEPFGSVVDQLVLPVDIDFFQLQGIDDPISLSSIRALKDARDLRSCVVSCCSGLESIFSSSSFSEDSQIFLGTVESFFLSYLPSFRVFYDGITPPCSIYFNLQELCFWKCDIMENIFPVLLLQNFPNLRLLIVIECENVEDIIVEAAEISDWGNLDSKLISLPNLQMLQLTGLPKLKSIYSGMMVCQSIEVVHVQKCPMVRRLPLSLHMDSSQSTPPPSLKCIEVEEEWWDSLEWDDPHAKAILQPFMSRGFQTHAEQNLCAPDLKSRGEKASECLQLLVPQYSDATMSISDSEIPSGTAPKGVLSMEEELSEEISLEELKETPSDPRELEDLNRDPIEVPPTLSHQFSILHKLDLSYTEINSLPQSSPIEVPPTLSHHFSILHKLDLSYTEINSLPQSISRLVALQILVLRNCELLMELPPEIGELTNLEVLDLEGTEMLCLPKEIAKLVNLTCLKVSFYGFANSRVIPRRVLSSLLRLNELIIDGTPYGEWWDVEVKAIMEDIVSLKELRTLKLYLPTAELLEDLKRIFPGLANFRFTVGRHEEHFISRLPRDVAEEFNNREKLEKGLKYINGSDIPNEITKVLKHANAFFLQRHWTAKSLSEFGHANMIEVKFCLVMECNELRTIVDSEQFYRGKDGRGQSEAIILGSLERLIIRYMKNMETIWKGPVGIGSLSYLKSLALHTCPNLTTLFTIDMFRNLINLEELIVEDCPKIDSLVSLKSSDSKSGLFLPNLKKISLLELPELVSISTGLWIAPKLERMVIYYCPKLEKLSTMDVSSRKLKEIKGEKEWWDALKWYESDLSTEHADYLVRLFIPL